MLETTTRGQKLLASSGRFSYIDSGAMHKACIKYVWDMFRFNTYESSCTRLRHPMIIFFGAHMNELTLA